MIQDFIHETRHRLSSMFDERRPLDAILGIPAVLVVLLLGFMFLQSREATDAPHVAQMEKEAQAHLDKGRFVEARIAAMRLTQDGVQSQKAVLIEAKALRGMGREMEASRLLARLAPADHPGYAPAHVMQAAILLAQAKPDVQNAGRHMNLALQSDPTNVDALELAARFAAGRNDWKTALHHLSRIDMKKRGDLLLMKATALQLSGMTGDSIKTAREAEAALRAMHASDESGTDSIRFSIAVSLSLQRQFEKAVQWMLSSHQGEPTREERQVLGGIYLSWSRHVKEQPGHDRSKAMELLEQGIQISPESQDLIMAFLNDCDELPVSAEQRGQYVSRILSKGGIATSFMHYYLGVQDWKRGDKNAARAHFELASSLNSGFGVISNNLAMAIASVSEDRAELEKALAMMDELIKLDAENPFYLDTRGHVLAKLGQYKEAVRDLEHSLARARDKKSTHAKLAQYYQQLGMPDLATEHRSAALASAEPSSSGKTLPQ